MQSINKNFYSFKKREFQFSNLALLLFFAISSLTVFSQGSSIELLPTNEVRVDRLAADMPTAQSDFLVDGGTTLRIHVRSNASGVITTINCPNGQTITSGNITAVNGTYSTNEIQDGQLGLLSGSEFTVGFHYVFEFPIQGIGSYNVSFTAPSSANQETYIFTDLSSDSTLRAKLFNPLNVISGKPIVLTLVLLDEATAVVGANVSGEIRLPNGTTVNKTFVDDGLMGDYQAGDGLYSAVYTPTAIGKHTVSATAAGVKATSEPFQVTAYSSFSAEPFLGRLTGEVDDFGVDDNFDTLFDRIVVRSQVKTTVAGEFGAFVHLKTANGKYLIKNQKILLETPGLNSIDVSFDAESFTEIGENGPYEIEKVELIKYQGEISNQLDMLQNLGQTQAYQISQLKREPIVFTGSNQFEGIDLNDNSKFDVLKITVGINVARTKAYLYAGTLFDSNGNRIDSFSQQITLTEGDNQIPFSFNGGLINRNGVSGVFKLRNVVVREIINVSNTFDGGVAISVENLLETPSYDVNQFDFGFRFTDVREISTLDYDGNGKFDLLRLDSEIEVEYSGLYRLDAQLYDSNGNIIEVAVPFKSDFNSGIHQIQFEFIGFKIGLNAVNGPYRIGVILSGPDNSSSEISNFKETAPYFANQFEGEILPTSFFGQITETPMDVNNNGKYDVLAIHGKLYSQYRDVYTFTLNLKDSSGRLIQTVSFNKIIFSGINNIDVNFVGTAINSAGINGNLSVRDVTIFGNQGYQFPLLYTTNSYNSDQFEFVQTILEGVDLNSNGIFDELHLKTPVFFPNKGPHYAQVSLADPSGNLIETRGYDSNNLCGNCFESFESNVDGIMIFNTHQNGLFKLSCFERTITGKVNLNIPLWAKVEIPLFATKSLDSNHFEKGIELTGQISADGIDINENRLYEILRVKIGLKVLNSGYYGTKASIKDSSGRVVETVNSSYLLQSGINTLSLDFNGSKIFSSGINEPITVGDVQINFGAAILNIPTLFTTQTFNSDQFEIQSVFTGENTAQGIDNDRNGQYEVLRVSSQFMSTFDPPQPPPTSLTGNDEYHIRATLVDGKSNRLQVIEFNQRLEFGKNTINFDFSGANIVLAQAEGPYSVEQVNVEDPSGAGFEVSSLFTFNGFKSSQFELSPSLIYYSSFSMLISGDGDTLLEPGEIAYIYPILFNGDNVPLSDFFAKIISISTDAEILTDNAQYPTINPHNESRPYDPFIIKLKSDAVRNSNISIGFTFESNLFQSKTDGFMIPTN